MNLRALPNARELLGPADAETEKVRLPLPAPTDGSGWLVQIYPTGKGIGNRYPVSEEPLLLGRDLRCHVPIESDASVSRFHAQLVVRGDAFYLTDYRSTNGTFVNDEPIVLRVLRDGDYVRVGRHIFRFLTGANVESQYHEEVARLVVTDALTGIANRRALVDFLEREWIRSRRYARPLACILLDIDHFKAINDRLGHLAGDRVLRDLAGRLRATVRTDELLARFGGEEFALVLPESDQQLAIHAAERLRHLAESELFEHKGERFPVTISLGVSCMTGAEGWTPLELLNRADENLYRAKEGGRNRVVA